MPPRARLTSGLPSFLARALYGVLLPCLLAACAAGGDAAPAAPVAGDASGVYRAPVATPEGTAASSVPVPSTAVGTVSGHAEGAGGLADPRWMGLRERLRADGVSDPRLDAWIDALGDPTQSPMGRKMRELYRRDFLPKPPPTKKPRLYRGVVTAENAAACRRFVEANRGAFERAETRYGVPASIAVSLLFVETRLGAVLADVPENAFHTLASMAVSRGIDDISDWLVKMPGWEKHKDWFARLMPRRAEWAYRETRALARVMLENDLPPERFPSSVYGAVGLCQFMPSNIPAYGVDGNGDGIVDLFQVDDAVMSLASYLARHGWKGGVPRARQHALLMTYNHADVYANTILALADLVAARPAQSP